MIHSIISWDCSYRNFFHLIDAFHGQEFDKNEYELIFVEQRSKAHANAWNAQFGLPALEDRDRELGAKFNLRTLYLDDDESVPYHLGRCVNKGLEHARGKYISVMDGDQLLEPDFLHKLTDFFQSGVTGVVNLHRRSAVYPVEVDSYTDWTRGASDFKACLGACPDKNQKLSAKVGNFGPMVGASAEHWHEIGGYDESPLWASVLSRAGYDVNVRLEIASKTESKALPNTFAVHPWHPIGGGGLRNEKKAKAFFQLQQYVIDWSIANNESTVIARKGIELRLIDENRDIVGEINRIQNGEMEDLEAYWLHWEKVKVKLAQAKDRFSNLGHGLWQ